jgi:hypothetical protein
MPKGTTCWRVDVDGHGFYHWFLKDPDGNIVDLTLARLKTGGKSPSMRRQNATGLDRRCHAGVRN